MFFVLFCCSFCFVFGGPGGGFDSPGGDRNTCLGRSLAEGDEDGTLDRPKQCFLFFLFLFFVCLVVLVVVLVVLVVLGGPRGGSEDLDSQACSLEITPHAVKRR